MATYNFLFKDISEKEVKLKGVGSAVISKLKKLGISTVYDLFYYFPKGYEDRNNNKKIVDLLNDEFAVIKGTVIRANNHYIGNKRYMFKVILADDTGTISLSWFNNMYAKKNLKIGEEYIVSGKVKKIPTLQMTNPEYKLFKENEKKEIKQNKNKISQEDRMSPLYASTASLKQDKIKKIIYEALLDYGYLIEENLPDEFIEKAKLIDRKTALINIHFPENNEMLEKARYRFMMEEIFLLEIGILKDRYEIEKLNKNLYKLEDNKTLVSKFIKNLGYELTKSQKKVISEIYRDLNSGKIINRLIQGDVGSGKTIVSMIMLLYMVENGYQGVIMAPTEILVIQHFLGIVDKFLDLDVRVEVLTASIKGKKKEKLLAEIEEGMVDIVIGTHSLIEDNVKFKNLGLIVIDEQHKFGVNQRKLLREKGNLSNLIVMSATPIPRSLALTIYGDLDVSIIDELPKGRQPIKTKWIQTEDDKNKMYEFIRIKLNEGRQLYVVSPLIDESESLNVKSAQETYEEYKKIFPDKKLGLLHGKQKNEDKQKVMEEFKKGRIDILISTTVVEVGVDVANASIIVIRDAQRFGLSSLHQLRGRVGRGKYKSYCFLESDTTNEISGKRLEIMEKLNDGFKISEEDLKLRNSGEILGTKQSGVSDMALTDIIKNVKEIKNVRDYVIHYLDFNDGNIKNEYLKRDIYHKFNENKNGNT